MGTGLRILYPQEVFFVVSIVYSFVSLNAVNLILNCLSQSVLGRSESDALSVLHAAPDRVGIVSEEQLIEVFFRNHVGVHSIFVPGAV